MTFIIIVSALCVLGLIVLPVMLWLERFKRKATDALVATCRDYALGLKPAFETDYTHIQGYARLCDWECLVTAACAYLGYLRVTNGLSPVQVSEYLRGLRKSLRAWRPTSAIAFTALQRFAEQIRIKNSDTSVTPLALWITAHLKGLHGTIDESHIDQDDMRFGSHLAGTLASLDNHFAESVGTERT